MCEDRAEKAPSGPPDALPFPETDLSPALQRAIAARLESGEIDEAEREELLGILTRSAAPERHTPRESD